MLVQPLQSDSSARQQITSTCQARGGGEGAHLQPQDQVTCAPPKNPTPDNNHRGQDRGKKKDLHNPSAPDPAPPSPAPSRHHRRHHLEYPVDWASWPRPPPCSSRRRRRGTRSRSPAPCFFRPVVFIETMLVCLAARGVVLTPWSRCCNPPPPRCTQSFRWRGG